MVPVSITGVPTVPDGTEFREAVRFGSPAPTATLQELVWAVVPTGPVHVSVYFVVVVRFPVETVPCATGVTEPMPLSIAADVLFAQSQVSVAAVL
jgi:hypothetical protein